MSMTRKDSPRIIFFDTSMRDCFSPHEKDEESKKLESKKTREEESEHI